MEAYDNMEAYNFARWVQYHPIWVAEIDQRQAIVNAYFEKYYGCELNKIPTKSIEEFEFLKRFLHFFMFDRRGIEVPEYLLERWTADEDGIKETLQFRLDFKHGIPEHLTNPPGREEECCCLYCNHLYNDSDSDNDSDN
jgi:hypothetical protein